MSTADEAAARTSESVPQESLTDMRRCLLPDDVIAAIYAWKDAMTAVTSTRVAARTEIADRLKYDSETESTPISKLVGGDVINKAIRAEERMSENRHQLKALVENWKRAP